MLLDALRGQILERCCDSLCSMLTLVLPATTRPGSFMLPVTLTMYRQRLDHAAMAEAIPKPKHMFPNPNP